MKIIIIIILLFNILQMHSQFVKFSPAWFGPNANPVPEFTDARIPAKTTISLMGDHYFGYGDRTFNGYFKIEIPLLPHRGSLKLWSTVLEHYQITGEIASKRGMSGALSGKANGDLYVQTRALILNENKYKPNLILNITLKTSSGTGFTNRRYFDTPGYAFDLEAGKSILTGSKTLSEIRTVLNFGFFCWETTGGRQNDAPVYGLKLILKNPNTSIENSISGYHGWMHKHPLYGKDYGDNPLVYNIKVIQNVKNFKIFGQYQYGIRDYPYHQLRFGFTFEIPFLTPSYQ